MFRADHTPAGLLSRLAPFFPPHLVRDTLGPAAGRPRLLDGTVLIADLKGFSALAARLLDHGPDEGALLALVNHFNRAVLGEVPRFGGSPVFFDGDALSVLFEGAGHADRALAAAVAARRAVAQAPVNLPGGAVSLQASFGLGSGTLLSASLGQGGALVYTLLGRGATEAVGAQKAAAGPQIIAADSTRAALTAAAKARPVAPGYAAIEDAGGLPDPGRAPEEPHGGDEARAAAFLLAHFPDPINRQLLEGDPGPQPRTVAALFVNLDGLDAVVSRRGLDAVPELNRLFAGLRGVVDEWGGFLNKVNPYAVGDKYLVLFGLPNLPCGDPAAAALRTAFDLQALVGTMPLALRQRIGLSAGRASVCVVGGGRRELTVLGRPVNEAVHLMERARWGEVVAVGGEEPAGEWTVRREQMLLKGYSREVPVSRFSPGAMFC
jgi:class 3 adenylate cyclase